MRTGKDLTLSNRMLPSPPYRFRRGSPQSAKILFLIKKFRIWQVDSAAVVRALPAKNMVRPVILAPRKRDTQKCALPSLNPSPTNSAIPTAFFSSLIPAAASSGDGATITTASRSRWRSALLLVPSIVVPEEANFLVNPDPMPAGLSHAK